MISANANANEDRKGVSVQAYKALAVPVATESEQVHMWRDRILRATIALNIPDRIRDAVEGDRYLLGIKETQNSQTIYIRYLLPILEDLHRHTMPRIPNPQVEARTDQAEPHEDKFQEWINTVFELSRDKDSWTIEQLQADDDRFGCFVASIEWETQREPKLEQEDHEGDMDPSIHEMEQERAEQENQEQGNLSVTDGDLHRLHLEIHQAYMQAMDMEGVELDDPKRQDLAMHIDEHRLYTEQRVREEAVLRRVPVDCYLYDPDAIRWDERNWEMERKSVPVRELVQAGCRNVNPMNAPPESRDDLQGHRQAYQDMTVRVWYVHDKVSNELLLISADGPADGLFLKRVPWPYGSLDTYRLDVFRPCLPNQTWGIATIQVVVPILEQLARIDYYIDLHVKNHASYKTILPAIADTVAFKAGLNDPNSRFTTAPLEALMHMKEYKPPEIPSSLLEHRNTLLNEIRRATGLDAQDVGVSNPHRITATESANRSEMSNAKRSSRQEKMSKFLSWVGITKFLVHRNHGTLATRVRVQGSAGVEFLTVKASEIPEEYDLIVDVAAETDEARVVEMQKADKVWNALMGSPLPIDMMALMEWYLKKMGVRRPEQFRLSQPEGVEQQQPGLPGQATLPNEPHPQVTLQGGVQPQSGAMQQTAPTQQESTA